MSPALSSKTPSACSRTRISPLIQQIHEFPVCTRIIEHLYLRETLFRMTGPNYGLWYVHLPKAWDGMRYGYRVDGAWDPKHGVRFNPYKFLLDPYGKGIDGSMELTPRRLLL